MRNFLTPREVTERYRLSPKHQSDMRSANGLPYFKVGKKVLYREDQFIAWFNAQGQNGAEVATTANEE